MDILDTLASIAADLTAALSAGDRYQRLLVALHRIIPFDAAALLRLEDETLTALAAHGLAPDAMGRRYARSDHPRLDIICKSSEPVRFPADSALPDPFDGLLAKDAEVKADRFRADLYHRLNVYPIKVPALRERKEDISLLTGYFCERMQRRLGLGPVRISTHAVEVLSRYSWPGNVRELENIISRFRSAIIKSAESSRGRPTA